MNCPEVVGALEVSERAILVASTAKTIGEYSGKELAEELRNTLKWIAKDIGYRSTDEGEAQYLVIRTAEILKRYYANFTLKDFRMAFEMCLTGELDEYLPKGRDGQPDRGHYQQFNAEYICKILRAYKSKRGEVLKKANEAVPQAPERISEEERKHYSIEVRKDCIAAYLYYKYHGRLPYLSPVAEMLYYEMLASSGLAESIEVTMAEQREILQRTIAGLARENMTGDVNRLKKEGPGAKELQGKAYAIARRKALRSVFDWMVKNEIQITDYIKL